MDATDPNRLILSDPMLSRSRKKKMLGACRRFGTSPKFDAAMKKTATLFIAGIVSCALFAQNARLVFAGTAPNEAYVTFNPNPGAVTTYMVIDNDAANAITQLAAGNGNIKSEHQNNRIRWRHQVGPLAVNYVIPWTTASNVKIPLTISKTAGTATHDSASFVLATFNHQVWAGSNANTMWQNVNYMPTGVTHMNDFYLGSVDNSENAVAMRIPPPRTRP
jgi:hypothetical protein